MNGSFDEFSAIGCALRWPEHKVVDVFPAGYTFGHILVVVSLEDWVENKFSDVFGSAASRDNRGGRVNSGGQPVPKFEYPGGEVDLEHKGEDVRWESDLEAVPNNVGDG